MLEIYRNKKVFVTGHTGFKGSWLSYVLCNAGAIVKGYALQPDTEPSLYNQLAPHINIHSVIADINDAQKVEEEILNFAPDFIFHLAAQPLVKKILQRTFVYFFYQHHGHGQCAECIKKIT